MNQATALVRAHAWTSGQAALRRGLPVYAGLFALAGLLFGGNGLSPATVVAGAEASTLARALLWAAWWLLALPTVGALWRTREGFWLRSMPAPRAWHLAILTAFSALAEAPWVALWTAGGGALAGLGALGGALLGHAALLARPRGAGGLVLAAATAAAVVLAPPGVVAIAAWPPALAALRAAWLAAPTRDLGATSRQLAGPPPLALAAALLVGLWRGQAPALLRGALLTGLAAAAAWLAIRNNELRDPDVLQSHACGFLAAPALASGSAASGPMLALERGASWLLDVAGASGRQRLGALTLAAAAVGAGLGAAAGACLAWALALPAAGALRLVLATLAGGAGLAAIAGLASRWSERFGARGPGRLIVALFAALVAALSASAWLGAAAPWAWLAGAACLWLVGHVRSDGADAGRGGGEATVLLHIDHVRKRLGTRVVLDDVDLSCKPGEIALVLGENGSGKSTLLRITAGIVEPDRGLVRVGGAALAGGDPTGRRGLGYAPDTADAFPDLSVRELVDLVAALRRAPPPPALLRARLGLEGVWRQRLRTLSFGQVKRTYLLAAMIGAPPLWLLDEPSNGLDPDGLRLVAALLREHAAAGGGALVTTNDATFAALLDATRHRLAQGHLSPA